MKEITFKDFKSRLIDFWRENLQKMGYEYPEVHDFGDWYSAHLTRFNPRENKRQYTLNILYENRKFEITEQFANLSEIPEEYGDMHDPNMDWEQPPMFIYGVYQSYGYALKSLLKGDSINLRPYSSLYY